MSCQIHELLHVARHARSAGISRHQFFAFRVKACIDVSINSTSIAHKRLQAGPNDMSECSGTKEYGDGPEAPTDYPTADLWLLRCSFCSWSSQLELAKIDVEIE